MEKLEKNLEKLENNLENMTYFYLSAFQILRPKYEQEQASILEWLAKAHTKSLYKLLNVNEDNYYDTFNIGTGKGTSVLELIKCFENVTENKLNFKIGDRREGDVAECFADVSKANKILNWKSELSIKDSLLSSWNWEKNINNEKLQ